MLAPLVQSTGAMLPRQVAILCFKSGWGTMPPFFLEKAVGSSVPPNWTWNQTKNYFSNWIWYGTLENFDLFLLPYCRILQMESSKNKHKKAGYVSPKQIFSAGECRRHIGRCPGKMECWKIESWKLNSGSNLHPLRDGHGNVVEFLGFMWFHASCQAP